MAITLVGEVVNSADSTAGFSAGSISGDDDFVQGTGALGSKVSSTTTTYQTTSLGPTAPYNFSVGGAEEGWHYIGWFNSKTPINATSGFRFFMGTSGTNFGHWYVVPTVFYKGGFITKVIDPTRNFDVTGGTFSAGGNPAQLNNITNMGIVATTTTSIMGSFNNIQLDQFTIGLGIRADAGTVGTPNTFELVRAQDEDSNFWGWWSSTQGAVIGKGKLFIGPETGTATSVFTDVAFKVIFASELVALDFYEIVMRGANTQVDWNLASIGAADPSVARWSLTVDGTITSFSDTNGVWTGSRTVTLSPESTLTGTTLIDGVQVVHNDATMAGAAFLSPSTASGVAYITTDNMSNVSDCSFESAGTGHAIEITAAGTYTFQGHEFGSGYNGTGNNAAVWFNPVGGTGDLIINVTGGGNISAGNVRNSSTGSVTVNNAVPITLTGLVPGSRVYIENTTDSVVMFNEIEATDTFNESVNNATGKAIRIRVRNASGATKYKSFTTTGTITGAGFSLTVNQELDQ